MQQGHSGFRIEGDFSVNEKKEKALCILRETGKKEFSVNQEEYDKFSKHIGRYPCVVVAPDDAQLVTGGSEERRKFLDLLLSQLDAAYLQNLIAYNKILQQRNSLLRSFADTGDSNFSLLDILDEQLGKYGDPVFHRRKEFLTGFLPLVKQLYSEIAQQPEELNLVYESELSQASFAELLQLTRQSDCFVQRTSAGIHRDDLDIKLSNHVFRYIASQGQRKSLLFALKLAEMDALKRPGLPGESENGFAPLLLLDDVFEKLDEDRISNLLYKVCAENRGQVFITDTSEARLKEHLEKINIRFGMIRL